MTISRSEGVVAAAGAALLASPVSAIVSIPTAATIAYQRCVERVADRDAMVRTGLVEAVAYQIDHRQKQFSDRWKTLFERRVMPACGKAPRILAQGEPPTDQSDASHSAYIAVDLVQRGGRVVKTHRVWNWRSAMVRRR